MSSTKISHSIKISNLKLLRIQKGLKQSDLASLSGIPVKCIGNYEQKRRDINKAQACIVYKLAKALNCSIEDILDVNGL